MEVADDILNESNLADWRGLLHKQAREYPDTWADRAFSTLAKYRYEITPLCEEIFAVGEQAGWGSFGKVGVCLLEAMRHDRWDLAPWILKAPVEHDISSDEIDYLTIQGLDRGFWTHLDLLRPQAMLDERNVGRVGHDIFKHNENSYYAPLNEAMITQLIKLPKHETTGAILGKDFALTQRVPDCYTDLDAPGALPSLVLLVNAGWLDLGVAKSTLEPRETKALEAITRIEKAALECTSSNTLAAPTLRRM